MPTDQTTSNKILLIDDMRNEDSKNVGMKVTKIARTYKDGLEQLKFHGPWDLLLLDHDLACFEDGRERTGYDLLCWLEEFPQFLPKDILVITDNASVHRKMKMVVNKLYNCPF